MKKKIITILIIIVAAAAAYGIAVAVGHAVMAGSQPITDGELAARMGELIPRAAELNDVIWGGGLPVDPDAAPALDTVTGAQYRPVAPDAPYHSVAELRAAVDAVYCADFVDEVIKYILFEEFADEEHNGAQATSPRYADRKQLNDDGSTTLRLNIDITHSGFTLPDSSIDPASVRFKSREVVWDSVWWRGDAITVTVTRREPDGSAADVDLVLRRQNGEWFLDSPTY